MARIFHSVEQLIGGTPLLELSCFSNSARLLAKLESFNPTGSVKDRAARAMLDGAQQEGLLSSGSVIIEPTSGNTGIGLCAIGTARGYRVIIVMPEHMSAERRMLMEAYGGEVILTPAALGMAGAIAKAQELAQTIPNSFLPLQFDNPANAQAHYLSTGPEIWTDTDGKVDLFVCGVGTGGTLTGTARFLKEKNPRIRIVAVEPQGSAVLSGAAPGNHGLQGIGPGFVPRVLDSSLIDEVLTVTEEAAYVAARRLAKQGLLVGISSGAVLDAALRLAQRSENAGKNIVLLLPDSGERYLSTPLFAP